MLKVDAIGKRFGEVTALDGCSLTVERGRMLGFLGPNGAGKTTTMRAIFGLVELDTGAVLWDGDPIGPDQRLRFGYMPEERGLYPKMKVGEHLVYLARLHGLTPAASRRNAQDLLERLGLGERAGDTVQSLSLGNQQRAQIAAALVHDPEFLVLDEPFSGLDPIAVEVVQGVLKDRATSGAPVLFSSHQLDIVERLCDDLVIIADGEIRANGTRERLRDEHSSPRFEIRTGGDAGWIRHVPGVTVLDVHGDYAVFEAATDAASQAVVQQASQRGSVLSFGQQRPSLATIFKEIVK